jgi:hypothetical protein
MITTPINTMTPATKMSPGINGCAALAFCLVPETEDFLVFEGDEAGDDSADEGAVLRAAVRVRGGIFGGLVVVGGVLVVVEVVEEEEEGGEEER